MNPSRGETRPSPNLEPGLQPEALDDIEQTPERLPAAAESSPSKQPSSPIIADPQQIAADTPQPVVPAADDDQTTTLKTDFKDTSHGDKIEKHWIDSAKKIIAQTKDDPYKQKNEMSKFKADYIKQRFEKVIKAEPDSV